MNRTAGYVWIIVALVLAPMVLLGLGALVFPSFSGNLTRIGGFSESDYGWQEHQEVFAQPLFTAATAIDDYSQYYDVVVIGDSFSFDKQKGWQNYFVEQTGLSVITFHHGVSLERLFHSKMFMERPPQFFIVESLEQFALERLTAYNTVSEAACNVTMSATLPRFVPRPAKKSSMDNHVSAPLEQRVAQTRHFFEKSLERQWRGDVSPGFLQSLHNQGLNSTTEEVYSLPLNQEGEGLFSSREKGLILVYGLDIAKISGPGLVSAAAQGVKRLQCRVESNGRSRFVLMLFPDKLSVYTPLIKLVTGLPSSLIPPLAGQYPNQVRLDVAFNHALENRVTDLYLPNDTHTGYAGYRIAAQALTAYLQGKGFARIH